ncbi:MAG: hypothetical protein AAF985_06190, partial [Bacteroidota bacterium]
MKQQFLLLLIGLGIMACSKDNSITPTTLIHTNRVNLSDLRVGQQSYFVQYETSCAGYESDFIYTGDTLVLEVVEQEGQIALKESFTPYSPLYLDTLTHQ